MGGTLKIDALGEVPTEHSHEEGKQATVEFWKNPQSSYKLGVL